MSEEKIQRDELDNARTEIQRLHDLEASDIENFKQHREILDEIKKLGDALNPISETYKTVGTLAKWFMAFLVFLSVLGGVIFTWGKIFKKE